MEYLIPAVLYVFGALVIAIIIAYARKRRLYLVVPKIYSHTELPDQGQAFQLGIYNNGPVTEEGIRIQLAKDRTYTLAASTDSSVELSDNEINISRLNNNDEMSLILFVGGGEFTDKSILKVASKDVKGIIIDAVEKVPMSFPTIVKGTLAVLIVGILFIAAPTFMAYQTGKLDGKSEVYEERLAELEKEAAELEKEAAETDKKPELPPELIALQWEAMDEFVSSEYYKETNDKLFPIKILYYRNEKNSAVVKLVFANNASKRVKFSASLISPHGIDGPGVKFGDHFNHDILLFPGEHRTVILKIVQPKNAKNKTIIVNVNMQYKSDAVYNLEKELWIE